MPVELIWDGKYHETPDGKRARVAPVRIPLPFQTVETVNESGSARARQLDLFAQGKPTDWRNRLIWGDKKYVLPSLLPEFAGKVNLIYIDPPFATGADFSFTTTIPESDESFTKEPSIIEQKAYRDTWGRGLDSYLQWFYETVALLRELLAEDGSIYVHLDDSVGHYAKAVLDEVFGEENFRNEIVREKTNPKNFTREGFGNIHDVIFFYTKSDKAKWSKPYAERDEAKINSDFPQIDSKGRRYKTAPLHAPGLRNGESGRAWRNLMPPSGNHWRYIHSTLEQLDSDERIEWSSTGNPREKIYADESQGVFLQDIWLGLKDTKEIYPTAKNPDLLERIILASSEEGDLVLDCFCGSGTTAAVAEKLGRRWITCDLGRFAIHTARKRLLAIPNVRPFDVQNLGKYERQAWQVAEFGQGDERQAEAAQLAYRRFILDLYRAQPLEGFAWLHGLRDGRFVHVGGVDAPVALGDVQAIAREVWRAGGQGATNAVDILGWDFAFNTNETVKQTLEASNVRPRFLIIPREVLEKKAVEQGDIRFFELAALSVRVSQKADERMGEARHGGRHVTITLTDFIVPPDDAPDDIQRAITHWSQWIDYWAVDWDFQGDAFHNMAQHYRTRKDPKLPLSLAKMYDEPGTYQVVVKVIDILGNDTSKTLTVEVK